MPVSINISEPIILIFSEPTPAAPAAVPAARTFSTIPHMSSSLSSSLHSPAATLSSSARAHNFSLAHHHHNPSSSSSSSLSPSHHAVPASPSLTSVRGAEHHLNSNSSAVPSLAATHAEQQSQAPSSSARKAKQFASAAHAFGM